MSQSRADFKMRLSRLPRRQIPESYVPAHDPSLGLTLSPLIYVISGAIGFLNFFILPYVFRSFSGESEEVSGATADGALDAIWTIPSIGLAFAGSVVFMSIFGLTGGGHFRAVVAGIVLALAASHVF